jgi:predicted 3-demethylubiquinone-9 3-methyltransferase (glyoxalase superfamily)
MSQTPIVPCLWFDDQAEPAANFYFQAFREGEITARAYYPLSRDNPTARPRGDLLTVEFVLAGQRFVGLNGGPRFEIGPSISFFVQVEFGNEAEKLFNALAVGGRVLMPLGAYPWSERYGWVQDRYGVSWQVIAGARERGDATIVPCFMFSGEQHRRAEEAIRHYVEIFPESAVLRLERYAEGEGPEGTIKHGRFVIAGQQMVAMDSHIEHGSTFNEGVSLQVFCSDQVELDSYWAKLCEGGTASRCGWLKDRFGVSWQIVPSKLGEWLSSSDVAARDRVFEAMLVMDKLDIATLAAAFSG